MSFEITIIDEIYIYISILFADHKICEIMLPITSLRPMCLLLGLQ